jgi:hypothetical protein
MEPRRMPGVSWARKGHPERHRATYTRKAGTEQLLTFCDVHGEVLEGVIHKRKTPRDLLRAPPSVLPAISSDPFDLGQFELTSTKGPSAFRAAQQDVIGADADLRQLAESHRVTVYAAQALLPFELGRSESHGSPVAHLPVSHFTQQRDGQTQLPSPYT